MKNRMNGRIKHKSLRAGIISLLLVLLLCFTGCNDEVGIGGMIESVGESSESITSGQSLDLSEEPYEILNNNQPEFSEKEKGKTESFEKYSKLDSLGRCQVAYANISQDIMPDGERESIGSVKPSGWQTAKYDSVEGKYLYNRCHLIGYQLAGENANRKNLITGTRYFNVEGMLPFENQVADYVESTDNHVLYRVTPVYDGNNLVAKGVQMEAYSVEDKGEGVCFNVFVYNIQPGINIDYATGESEEGSESDTASSSLDQNEPQTEEKETEAESQDYIINKNTRKFHEPSCSSVSDTLAKNRKEYNGSRETLIQQGYSPCSRCHP